MAADQQKKGLNAASFVGCTSRQLRRVKRKMGSPQYDLNMRANIFLEWDNKKKSVVSKREQIGIPRRHFSPFMKAGARGHNLLADVISVPQEIFELESLSEVFSYGVWQNYLSEDERSLLSQFLPKGAESDSIVHDLLAGINFHFGNPFKKWGSSLCFGKLHPDNIVYEEQSLKTSKKAYYSDLQKYHDDMIGNLRTWKEKLTTCKDPEDIVQKIWRAKKHADKDMLTSESGFYDTEEHLVATPDSSWATSDKAYSSDNQNLVMMLGKSRKRKGFLDKYHDSSNGLKSVERPKKGEKVQKRNIQHGDGAKYMSYIKVSKEQHQRVKSSMKHSSNSIKPRSLNNVLGNIDTLHVQPFEVFEEEERKKLHYYWMELANKNVPEGYSTWRKKQLQRQQLTQSFGQEIRQNLKCQESTLDEEKDDSHKKQHEPACDSEEEIIPAKTVKDEEKEGCLLQEPIDNGEANCDRAVTTEVDEEKKTDYVFDEQTPKDTELSEDDNDDSCHVLIQDQQQQQELDSPNDGSFQFNSIEMESLGNDAIAKTDEVPSIMSEYPGNLNHADVPVSQQDPHPTTRNVWTAGNMQGSYYCSTSASDEYASAGELSLGHSQFIEEQPVQIIDLEATRRDKDVWKNTLHIQPDNVSFFTSNSNKARNELLQPFFKNQGSLPSHHEQKQHGLDGQFSGHFSEQVYPSLTLDPRQKRQNDLYLHQNIQESVYSMPKQEHLTVNILDWAPPLSHNINGENWYQSEHGVGGGWSMGAVGGSQSLGSGSNSDQTLYSVVSECNELRPNATYGPMGSTERIIVPGNVSGLDAGIPTSSNGLQQSANSLNYLSSHDAVTAIKTNIGWMGTAHQNSGLQESMGKPFIRSWNQ